MVVQLRHSTREPDHAQTRDPGLAAHGDRNDPGEPVPPGTRPPMGQMPALLNPSFSLLLLLHCTSISPLLSSSARSFSTGWTDFDTKPQRQMFVGKEHADCE